jgi:carboxylesterase
MIRAVTESRTPGKGSSAPLFAPRRAPAALCLHGFTGTPYEVAPLARALSAAGFSVSSPLLAGHGADLAALAATRWPDWLASAEAAFDRLREASDGGPVALVGFSMGGLLALRLARLRPADVSALVALSVPLRLRPWQVAATQVWRRLPSFLCRGPLAVIRKRGGSDVTDPDVRKANPGLGAMPIAGIAELVALGSVVGRDLAFVRQPTLVVHGERDRTVALASSYELAGSLAADVVEHLWLSHSAHLVGVDVERERVALAVVEFLRKHAFRARVAEKEIRPV